VAVVTLWTDATARGDQIAELMRDYYEANKPLRWWQRRRRRMHGNADNLMLGLLNVVLSTQTGERA
jgi:hypothetical protein